MRLRNDGEARRLLQPSTPERWIVLARRDPSGEVTTLSLINFIAATSKSIIILTQISIPIAHTGEQHVLFATRTRLAAELLEEISRMKIKEVVETRRFDLRGSHRPTLSECSSPL